MAPLPREGPKRPPDVARIEDVQCEASEANRPVHVARHAGPAWRATYSGGDTLDTLEAYLMLSGTASRPGPGGPAGMDAAVDDGPGLSHKLVGRWVVAPCPAQPRMCPMLAKSTDVGRTHPLGLKVHTAAGLHCRRPGGGGRGLAAQPMPTNWPLTAGFGGGVCACVVGQR